MDSDIESVDREWRKKKHIDQETLKNGIFYNSKD